MADDGSRVDPTDPTFLTDLAIERARGHTDNEIKHLKELLELAIATLKELMLTMFKDNETAVNAALASAEKANTKTEGNFAERIKQQDAKNDEIAKGLGDRITALETRVSKTEAAVGG